MHIGDIYAVEIPPSNGREQAGIRPAIIVQHLKYDKKLRNRIGKLNKRIYMMVLAKNLKDLLEEIV